MAAGPLACRSLQVRGLGWFSCSKIFSRGLQACFLFVGCLFDSVAARSSPKSITIASCGSVLFGLFRSSPLMHLIPLINVASIFFINSPLKGLKRANTPRSPPHCGPYGFSRISLSLCGRQFSLVFSWPAWLAGGSG